MGITGYRITCIGFQIGSFIRPTLCSCLSSPFLLLLPSLPPSEKHQMKKDKNIGVRSINLPKPFPLFLSSTDSNFPPSPSFAETRFVFELLVKEFRAGNLAQGFLIHLSLLGCLVRYYSSTIKGVEWTWINESDTVDAKHVSFQLS